MEVFHTHNKVNFVDENNVVVGYDMQSQCCEDYGYFFSRQKPNSVADIDGINDADLEGFIFDQNFYECDGFEDEKSGDYGSVAIFRLINGCNEIYLTLYNIHNGYYTHKFQVITGGEVIESGSL